MKKLWISIFAMILTTVGYVGMGIWVEHYKDGGWYYAALFLGGVFMIVPTVNYWMNFFNKLFSSESK